jgi:3',5'-cyclic AMP phosphodiesterase CpdA
MFLHTHGNHPEYAAETPYLFVNGNHDLRGRFARQMQQLLMFRNPAERASEYHDLGRNFVQRLGDVALIGLDTGEDKLDTNPLFANIFQMQAYREKQTRWLAEAIETPAVKTAKFKVAFCHIPLYDARPSANPGDLAPADKAEGYVNDYASWQRTCANLWGPLFARAGVQLVVTAHQHCFRYDAPTAERPWAQIVGGGCELDGPEGRFPTVIEGKVVDGRLVVTVHDLRRETVAGEFVFG